MKTLAKLLIALMMCTSLHAETLPKHHHKLRNILTVSAVVAAVTVMALNSGSSTNPKRIQPIGPAYPVGPQR